MVATSPGQAGLEQVYAGPRLPNVFLIGTAKSGTTYLASLLAQHPQVFLPRVKEPEFFSFDEVYEQGRSWYTDLYRDASDAKWILDASTGYTRFPEYPKTVSRLRKLVENPKFIYLLRHPIERAYSHYIHRRSKEMGCREPFRVSFEEHIEIDPMCINSSDYALQLRQYLEYFAPESILCVFSRDLRVAEYSVVQRICEHLGVDYSPHFFAAPVGRENESHAHLESQIRIALTDRIKSVPLLDTAKKMLPKSVREMGYQWIRKTAFAQSAEDVYLPRPMKEETRLRLLERFHESNAWVEAFTGVKLDDWSL